MALYLSYWRDLLTEQQRQIIHPFDNSTDSTLLHTTFTEITKTGQTWDRKDR